MEIMKVLAVGAHPDDIEIYMYGLLATYLERKDNLFLAIATDGAAGQVKNNFSLKDIRAKETNKALNKLGRPHSFNFNDGELSFNNKAGLIIKNYILTIMPDLIITHAPEDYHPDHNALSEYIVKATGFHCPILFADTLMGVNFTPEYYIDITKHFKEKEKAILNHESQDPTRFLEATKLLNRFRSAQCNTVSGHYAEAYRLDKRFPFSDIRSILPEPQVINPFYKSLSNSMI